MTDIGSYVGLSGTRIVGAGGKSGATCDWRTWSGYGRNSRRRGSGSAQPRESMPRRVAQCGSSIDSGSEAHPPGGVGTHDLAHERGYGRFFRRSEKKRLTEYDGFGKESVNPGTR